MIREVIRELESNKILLQLLGATAHDTHIYATHTNHLDNCLIYSSYTTGADKITLITRLTITIVADNLSLTNSLEREVKRTIITLADNQLTNNILQVALNGGGTIYDYDRKKHHTNLYFTIISRSDI